MTTLNNIIDDILLTARNGSISQSDMLSRNQVALWIAQYRALLIKREVDKNKEINDKYVQYIQGVPLTEVPVSGSCMRTSQKHVLETDKLPGLMVLAGRPALLGVYDTYGNQIQIGSKSKANYQKYRRYVCGEPIAYLQNSKLRIENNTLLQCVDVRIVAEDPADTQECGFENGPYPMPEDKIPLLKSMIFQNELGIRLSVTTDTENNAADDTQNKISNNAAGRQRIAGSAKAQEQYVQ